MSKFENLATGIVVSVDDSKDERFGDGWKAAGDKPAPRRKASAADSEASK
jgi:hypothetical protein